MLLGVVGFVFSFSGWAVGGQIHEAAKLGDAKKVLSFLKNNIDPNLKDKKGRTPLHLASVEGELEVATLLVKQGARVGEKMLWGKLLWIICC